jgi:hypothetical protein
MMKVCLLALLALATLAQDQQLASVKCASPKKYIVDMVSPELNGQYYYKFTAQMLFSPEYFAVNYFFFGLISPKLYALKLKLETDTEYPYPTEEAYNAMLEDFDSTMPAMDEFVDITFSYVPDNSMVRVTYMWGDQELNLEMDPSDATPGFGVYVFNPIAHPDFLDLD